MKVLVLGGYGLIGTAIMHQLLRAGHKPTGLGRSRTRGQAAIPNADWITADLTHLTTPAAWAPYLDGMGAVVNAAGLLQTGFTDNVAAVQQDAITALIAACESRGITQFIQISAPGAQCDSDTEFFRTKAVADERLKASSLNWTILRPGLVLSPHAYGGTSLIRRLAATPWIQPVILADAQIQTVHVDDVAAAVTYALEHRLSGVDVDLMEDKPHRLDDLILRVRTWLGFGAPRAILRLPRLVGIIPSRLADISGFLGWRSSLRTTSLRVLAKGVTGDASEWQSLTGQQPRSLEATLSVLPSTLQERLHARAMLWFPLLLIILSIFWIASGIIGLVRYSEAVSVLETSVVAPFSPLAVIGGGVLDILIGLALLCRPTVRLACLVAVLLSLAYLVGATLFVPQLWLDPLGPLMKILPSIGLAVIVSALAERR